MKYYSTNHSADMASLEYAVVKGLAPDKGLFMPEKINMISPDVIANMKNLSFSEIACLVAENLFGEDIDKDVLDKIKNENVGLNVGI